MSNSGFKVTTGRDGRRSFDEHDDRWKRGRGKKFGGKSYGFYKPRGPFQGGRGRGRGRGGGPDPRSRFGGDDDGDFSMSDEQGPSSGSRYNPYDRKSNYQNKRGGRPYNNRGRGGPDSRSSSGSGGYRNQYSGPSLPPSEWYKVQIPKAKSTGQDALIKIIQDYVNIPFIPTSFHYEGDKAVFFLKDSTAAESMGKFRNRFTLPNGMKMILIVKPSGPPYTLMDEDKIEKLKVCMSGRYDPPTKTLNLSSLYEDPGLLQDNLYLALNRNNIMTEVVKIIEENIPELEALDISSNRLMSLSTVGDLTKKAPNVIKLNIGKNSLHHLDEIDRLKGWKLEEIILDGNSLCDKYSDQASYISAVRKKFPKVLKLDGHDLPPPIKFDIESSAELPETKGSYFQSTDLQELIVKFLKEYFTIYDSDNRQTLMDAYHEHAVFSLSSAYNSVIEYTQPKLHDYQQESRNFIRMGKDTGRKERTLKQGKLNVVARLCLLPKSTHDYDSFKVDVDFVSKEILSFTVSGVFKEAESKADKPPIRAFSRTFITVPCHGGMVISNDMLTVTNATQEQFKAAFKHHAPTPSSSPVPEASPLMPFPPSGSQAGPAYTSQQQEMIQRFAVDSGMNLEWSMKCLEQNGWNYEKSGQVFLDLQKQGKIPPEAFIK